MSLAEFFHMGGYAFYVWSSYGIAFLVLGLNLLLPMFSRQRVLREIARKRARVEMMQR